MGGVQRAGCAEGVGQLGQRFEHFRPRLPVVHADPPDSTPCRDADCGEFCYELAGEAALPAAFAEHKAQLVPGGSGLVELPLPFVNHQLEAAKRLFQVGAAPPVALRRWNQGGAAAGC